MLAWLKLARDRQRTARSLYGSIVTQARSPAIYAVWHAPDTIAGRFEMIALHLAAVIQRLSREGEAGFRLGRALTEMFAADIDDNLREMTLGDLAVPREVKKAVAALQDIHRTYAAAFATGEDGPLMAAIQRRIGGDNDAQDLDSAAICAYIRDANRLLDALAGSDVLAGRIEWPRVGALKNGVGMAAGSWRST